MKFHLSVFCCLTFFQYCYADTSDNTVNFKTGLNIGFRTLNFEQQFNQGPLSDGTSSTNPAKRSIDFNQSFRSADFSAAASWSDFYLTANYETNIEAENAVVTSSYTDTTTNNQSNNDLPFEFDRYDYAVNLGWNAYENFSIFTGYKFGETKTSRATDLGTVGAPNGKVDTSFKESGPFIGLSYNWVLGHGVLTLSTAYAYMTGKYQESGDEIIYAETFVVPVARIIAVAQHAMQYEGHTDGISANLSWNVLASDHIAYYYGVRWQQYEFEADTDLNWDFYNITAGPTVAITPLNGTADVSNSETITAFYAGINYLF